MVEMTVTGDASDGKLDCGESGHSEAVVNDVN